MKIAILGAGAVGETLARLLVQSGHQVSITNSRGAESLTILAGETGETPASITDAVAAAQVIIIAIPTKAIPQLPKRLFADLPEEVVVIDTCNYHPELRDGHIEAIDTGGVESLWVAQHIGVPVVKAFNSILAIHLTTNIPANGAAGRIALPISGDSPDAKAITRKLIEELGFDVVDAGSLAESWRQQTGSPAYCADLNAESLVLALARAERQLLSHYREKREADLRHLIESSP